MLTILLLVTCITYFLKFLLPFFLPYPPQYTFQPIFVAKVVILHLTAVLLPLFRPREYWPVDPSHPAENPNPEQTASLLSLLSYSFVGKMMWLAYWKEKLDYEDLPPMADYDRAEHLRSQTFRFLSPFTTPSPSANPKDDEKPKKKPRKYLLWNLFRTFWRVQAVVALMTLVRALSSFASPFAVRELLAYLESRPHVSHLPSSFKTFFLGKQDGTQLDAMVEKLRDPLPPHTSILILFLGPVIGTLAFQWHIFVQTRWVVRCEAVLTQLVFEHALRIRVTNSDVEKEKDKGTVKAEAEGTSKATVADDGKQTPPVPAAETSIEAEGTDAVQASHETQATDASSATTLREPSTSGSTTTSSTLTVVAPTDNGKGKGRASPVPNPKEANASAASKKAPSGKNLVGKINNLVSSDQDNIINGRDFLMLCAYLVDDLVYFRN